MECNPVDGGLSIFTFKVEFLIYAVFVAENSFFQEKTEEKTA